MVGLTKAIQGIQCRNGVQLVLRWRAEGGRSLLKWWEQRFPREYLTGHQNTDFFYFFDVHAWPGWTLHQLNWISKISFSQNKMYSFIYVVCPLLPSRQTLRIFFDSPSNIVTGRNPIWEVVNDLRWNDGICHDLGFSSWISRHLVPFHSDFFNDFMPHTRHIEFQLFWTPFVRFCEFQLTEFADTWLRLRLSMTSLTVFEFPWHQHGNFKICRTTLFWDIQGCHGPNAETSRTWLRSTLLFYVAT